MSEDVDRITREAAEDVAKALWGILTPHLMKIQPALRPRVAKLVEERDRAKKALAEAAEEINCAGPVAHRIRVLRQEYVAQFEKLEAQVAALTEELKTDREVCVCGCENAAHESVDEGGFECGLEGHQCLRTCPAIRDMFKALTEERDKWMARCHAADVEGDKWKSDAEELALRLSYATVAEARCKELEATLEALPTDVEVIIPGASSSEAEGDKK